jgi:superfamily II DNA or RNA helicase
MPENSATSIHKEKRLTADGRAGKVADLISGIDKNEPICIWVDTDYEADAVRALLPDVIEVNGKMSIDMKEERLNGFSTGDIRVIMTKASIAGYGLNWQHCNQSIFCGLSFSYEKFYQAVRRFYRFGQKRPVNAHVVMADTEAAIVDVIQRKSGDHEKMKIEMTQAMARAIQENIDLSTYKPTQEARFPAWM